MFLPSFLYVLLLRKIQKNWCKYISVFGSHHTTSSIVLSTTVFLVLLSPQHSLRPVSSCSCSLSLFSLLHLRFTSLFRASYSSLYCAAILVDLVLLILFLIFFLSSIVLMVSSLIPSLTSFLLLPTTLLATSLNTVLKPSHNVSTLSSPSISSSIANLLFSSTWKLFLQLESLSFPQILSLSFDVVILVLPF